MSRLVVEKGATVVAPDGKTVTLTVNGVETGQKLTETGGTETTIQPGKYSGNVVVTVTDENLVTYNGLDFSFRQALYVDADGVNTDLSVLAAVKGKKSLSIRSDGEAFNGVYVNDGDYSLKGSSIELTGNGRSDFVGYGAAVTATGDDARVVLDDVDIDNEGAVRTGVVADGGSNVLVKNSTISTHDGDLPDDYASTVETAYMQTAPWMLGITGNVRATNLLGDETTATYLNSDISSTGWGVLSVDEGSDCNLTSINSKVTTEDEGYGSYAIGDTQEEFLGSDLDVVDYAAINRGGAIHYGDSTKTAVSELNEDLDIGLTAAELKKVAVKATTIDSERFGVMWHGAGSVSIDGRTRMTTEQTAFLDKGQEIDVDVDGSDGATVEAKNGVILQVMEDDDPGPVEVDGKMMNIGTYTEPTTDPTKDDSFDTTVTHDSDAVATFSDIKLTGDFYNGMRDGKNLALTFDGSTVKGVISASTTKHAVDTITSDNYEELGEVSNTVGEAVNNGVIVDLEDSTWTATGTSHLTSLSLDATSKVKAANGKSVSMTVDGVKTAITAGQEYTGDIVVSVK